MRHESQRLPEAPKTPELAALLAAARRTGVPGPGGEERATGAFLAARDEGAHAAVSWRRRRRDDWRPARRRRGAHSLRVMLGGFVAAATLGGVAVAAGSGAISAPFGDGESDGAAAGPTRTSPATPGGRRPGEEPPWPDTDGTAPGAPNAPGGVLPSGRPDRAQDDVALCRVYFGDRGNGKAMDATAFERLEAAAGGASDAVVTAYCDGLLGRPSPGESKRAQDDRGTKGKAEKAVPGEHKGGPAPSKGSGSGNGNGAGDRTAAG